MQRAPFQERAGKELGKQGIPYAWLESFSLARLFLVEIKGVLLCTNKENRLGLKI